MDNARWILFLRRRRLLHFSKRRGQRGDGEHASLRILCACANRAGTPAFFTAISHAAGVGAGFRRGGSGVGQRCWVKCAGMVCLEFYPGQLGGVANDEDNRYHNRSWTGGTDRPLTSFEDTG